MKKSLFVIIPLIVLLCFAVLFAAKKSPDKIFIVKDYLGHVGKNVTVDTVKKQDLKLSEYDIDELKKDSNVVFDQSLMLINTEYKIPAALTPDISTYKDVKMNECLIPAYQNLSQHIIDKFNNKVFISSSFRTMEEQEDLIKTEGDIATEVGASEHQMGLALDIYVKNFAGYSFIKSPEGQYINANCWKYGFIIRYPYYGKYHTKTDYEPWHIRYVGFPHAEIIYKNTLTLETYIDQFEIGKFYKYEDYIITRQNGSTFNLPRNFSSMVISEDNTGSYIITAKVNSK